MTQKAIGSSYGKLQTRHPGERNEKRTYTIRKRRETPDPKTIDALIDMLTEARESLPDGGQARVCLPDYRLLRVVSLDDEIVVVVLSAEAIKERDATVTIDGTGRHGQKRDEGSANTTIRTRTGKASRQGNPPPDFPSSTCRPVGAEDQGLRPNCGPWP